MFRRLYSEIQRTVVAPPQVSLATHSLFCENILYDIFSMVFSYNPVKCLIAYSELANGHEPPLITGRKNNNFYRSNCHSSSTSIVGSSSGNGSNYFTRSGSQRVPTRYPSAQRFKGKMLPSILVEEENRAHIHWHTQKTTSSPIFSCFCRKYTRHILYNLELKVKLWTCFKDVSPGLYSQDTISLPA